MKLYQSVIKKIILGSGILFLSSSVFGSSVDSSLSASQSDTKFSSEDPAFTESSVWQKVWGEPTPSAIYLGMVTAHFDPQSLEDRNWNNQLIGLDYKGYFAATLINSYNDRAYIAGIQRYVYTQKISDNFSQSLGYRVGLISGYDERISPLADVLPLLPFPQLIYDLSWNQLGLDFSVSVVAISAGFFYQF